MLLTELLYRPNAVKIHGMVYKPGLVIRIASDGGFWYGEITSIYVYMDIKFFVLCKLIVCSFIEHSRCLLVNQDMSHVIVTYEDFFCHGFLNIKHITFSL